MKPGTAAPTKVECTGAAQVRGLAGQSGYLDKRGQIWLRDLAANAIVHFDPLRQPLQNFPGDRAGANVRQMLGHPDAARGTVRPVVVRY
ncbi:MAG: hypothetical protein Q8P85_02695 [Pseudomonas sp.]|nr:hypothetical protein [Pseudomonas sp.]